MKKLLLLTLMVLLMSWGVNAQTATQPAGNGSITDPYQIASLENLYWISANSTEWGWDIYFIQTEDINASQTSGWFNGTGWSPIGNASNYHFSGHYDGNGHTITGLYIMSSSEQSYYGLFGRAETAEIKNLGITDVYIDVENAENVGALLGFADAHVTIDNCYSTGIVKGNNYSGGLVGELFDFSDMRNSYSTCEVSSVSDAGGLVGYCNFEVSVENCFHTEGIVTCNYGTGGLIGECYRTIILKCYSTGEVKGNSRTGGLVGINDVSAIYNSYSRCTVTNTSAFELCGGLVGLNTGVSFITNCYSTGSVVTGMGGLVGGQDSYATTTKSFWDKETSGTTSSAAGEEKSTTQMKWESTFTDAGWDFSTIWGMDASDGCNDGYPYLKPDPEFTRVPSVIITCDATGEICSNVKPVFTATPHNTGVGDVSYSWKVNGVSFGQDKNPYTLEDLEPGDIIKVSCEITVTDNANCESASATSEEITIFVTPVPLAGEISVDEGDNVIQVGGTITLSSTEEPGGFWSSANTAIATVDFTTGSVIGIGIGTTTIYYYKEGIVSECYNYGVSEFQITVVASSGTNTPPEISEITPSTTDPIAINESFSITVSYSDVDYNVETAVIDWGDGSPTTDILSQAADETYSHSYSNAGVYTITVTVNDGYGPVTKTYQYIVVYDPSAGFVTGGGWIESPICVNVDPAYGYMNVNGRANFGFVAKYQKGKVTPDGITEFQFKAGGLNFKSIHYEWLVIAGSKAMFKGSGTINGSGDFGFILSAVDADLVENIETDLFRIKIWDKANGDAVVYDNQCGGDDNDDPTTTISGGSIVIHSADKKTKSAEIIDAITPVVDEVNLNIYPNPFSERLNFEFVSPEDGSARIDIYDLSGRLIKTVFDGPVVKDFIYKPEFNPVLKGDEIFIYRMIFEETVLTGKAIYKK